MKRLIPILILCAVAVAACHKDDTVNLNALAGSYRSNTKTYVSDEGIAYWSRTNEKSVNINGTAYDVVYNDGNKAVIHDVAVADVYRAVYPADIVTTSAGSSWSVSLPKTQRFAVVNGHQQLYHPMAAYSTGGTLRFVNLCSLLKVTVANPDAKPLTLKRITVSASAAALCGTGTVSLGENPSLSMNAATDDTRSVCLDFTGGSSEAVIAASGSADYYVVLPPFASSDLTVSLNANTDEKNYTWSKTADGRTLNASIIARGPVASDISDFTTLLGSGTDADPYLLENYNDLNIAATKVNTENGTYGNKSYALSCDIDCGERAVTPIAKSQGRPLIGKLDGCGHRITLNNLVFQKQSTIERCGIVCYLKESGQICNLTVAGTLTLDFTSFGDSTLYVGMICAQENGTECSITNCHNYANINITASGNASGSYEMDVGGICGESTGPISGCSNHGNISFNGTGIAEVGGISGHHLLIESNVADIHDCYNTGSISCTSSNSTTFRKAQAGGIIGTWGKYRYNTSTKENKIYNCYNTGSIHVVCSNTSRDGTACAGGIVGSSILEKGVIGNCYNNGDVASYQNSNTGCAGGIIGGWNSGTNRLELLLNTVVPVCYSNGSVVAGSGGGIVGSDGGNLCRYSYYLSGGAAPAAGWNATNTLSYTGAQPTDIFNTWRTDVDKPYYTAW